MHENQIRKSRTIFDYGRLESVVEKSFTMDILGVKDKVHCSGLSKSFRKSEVEWTPQEIDIDSHLEVVQCFNQD